MHQSFETPWPPSGMNGAMGGYFTSYSLHFCSPVGEGYARNHGLRPPDRGISGKSLCGQVNWFHFRAEIISICVSWGPVKWGNRVRQVLNKTQTVPFIRAYKVCLARSRVYEKIASYLRSVISGPIVFIILWCSYIVEMTRKTLAMIESFVVIFHFVISSSKIERSFCSLQIVFIFFSIKSLQELR